MPWQRWARFLVLSCALVPALSGCATMKAQVGNLKTGMNGLKKQVATLGEHAGKLAVKAQSPGVEAKEVAPLLDQALLQCPERVWPGVAWTDLSVVLLDNPRQSAFVWNESGSGAVTPVDYGSVPEGFRRPAFAPGEWKGRKAVFIALDAPGRSAADVVESAVHEAFHLTGQNGWNDDGGQHFRGDSYPEEWVPRYVRRQLMEFLAKAFTGKDREALGTAASWYLKYRTEFPQDYESLRYLDRMEGTAEYAGVVSAAWGEKGCGVAEDQVREAIRQTIRTEWARKWGSLEWKPSAREAEPRAIGLLAGLLLDEAKVADWRGRVSEGETPMDILAQSVEAVPLAEDSGVLKKVQEYYEHQNEAMKKLLESHYGRPRDDKRMFLAIPFQRMIPGSFHRRILLGHKDEEYFRQFFLGMDALFASPDGRSRMELTGATVEIVDAPYPLGGHGYYVIPIRSSDLKKSKEGVYSIQSDEVKAQDLVFEVHETALGGKWMLVR